MRLLAAVGSLVFLAACTQKPATAVSTSYLRDIQPLVEQSCQTCHTSGGVAPFPLDTPEQVTAMATALWSSIEGNRMPPFFASSDCNSYQDDGRLTAAEKQLFKRWVDEGTPLGDRAEERHAPVPTIPVVRHDIDKDIGGDFDVRKMGVTDNYQCFDIDPGVSVDTQVVGIEVTPGNRAVVHHVLAYVVAENQLATLRGLDEAAPGLGYPCQSGGVGVTGAIQNQIAGWVPGKFPSRFPEGTAITLPAKSHLVVQIHYNLSTLPLGAAPFDRTQLAFETSTATLRRARVLPMVKLDLSIPANEANSVQVNETRLPPTAEGAILYGLGPHAHGLAKRIKLEVVNRSGQSTCLLDNPNWDFNWQRDYLLKTPYRFAQGDKLKITCTYDNSAGNQPYVDGIQQTSRQVTWGENTNDEMCMTYMTFSPP
jgi:hypothetical protein